MHTGVVLFFSACNSKALIWCDDPACAPLCQAYKADFPAIWPKLDVGIMVHMSIHRSETVARCITLEPTVSRSSARIRPA